LHFIRLNCLLDKNCPILEDDDKLLVFPLIQRLQKVGFNIVATEGTADYLLSQNISVNKVNKISKGGNTILPLLKRNEIKLAFITPSKKTVITDEFEIRQQLLIQKVPYVSTVPAMVESVRAIETLKDLDISVTALQDYYTTTG